MIVKSKLLRLGTALIASVVLVVAACATNPATGRPQFNLVSDKKAHSMGEEAFPQLRQEWGGDFNDPELKEYVSSVGKSLAEVSHSPGLPFEFRVTNSSSLNAVTLPGGKIFITRGLMDEMENEAQLAAVLGHEVGHATARHGQQAMTWDIAMQAAVSVASIVVEATTDTSTDRIIGYAALQAGMMGAQFAMFKYSRGQERQADDLGVVYMMKAGYNPDGAIQIQELLAGKEKGKPTYFESLLRSHPISEKRVRHVKHYVYENEAGYSYYRKGDGFFAERYKEKTRKIKEVNKAFEHYHKAQKSFEEGRTRDAIMENEKAISLAPDQAEFYVQKGDFYMAAKKYDDAEAAYNKAKDFAPDYYKVHQRLGHLARVRKKNDEAIAHHKKAIELNAGCGSSYIESGYAYMDKKDYKNSAVMLEAGTAVNPSDGTAFKALGYSYEKLGNKREAHDAYGTADGLSSNER